MLEWTLFYVPVALLFSIAPAFFTPWWNWYGSLCVVLITCSIAVGVVFAWLIPAPMANETSGTIGAIHVTSGALVLHDAAARLTDCGQARIDRVPNGEYQVTLNFSNDTQGTTLESIIVGDRNVAPNGDESYDIVIDCGEVVLADAEFSLRFPEAVLQEQLRSARKCAPEGRTFYAFLRNQEGTARAVVVAPPYGDGLYRATVSRGQGKVAVTWRVDECV
ncbi:MAG: hypothetical protein R3C10_00405 [Pirellulales bacterium]